MKFKEGVESYLEGANFHNGLVVDFIYDSKKNTLYGRNELLKEICSNKKIIHFGCADHLPLIEKKIKHNMWLHKILTEASALCIGIDINLEAVEFIKNHLYYNNVFYCNILTDTVPKEIRENQFDYIILGEIIEHVDDPVLFLKNLKQKIQGKVEKILITCPNSFYYKNFIHALKNQECINTDHRYWFTPFTITKVLNSAGLKMLEFYFVSPVLPRKNFIKKEFFRLFPSLQETLIIEASIV